MTLNELLNPFEYLTLPVGTMVEIGIEWLVDNFRTAFLAIKHPVNFVLSNIDYMLQSIPQLLSLTLIWILAWQIGGRRTGYTVLICMTSVGLLGIWFESMTTLSIVLTSIIFCSLVGVPIGIIIAKFDKFQTIARPILDTMQTIPSFVYLVPVVMLFGIGNVPGVIVTIIYALPPVIRLTNLGIRQVRLDTVEAARAFGASPLQTLFKVEIPLALPTNHGRHQSDDYDVALDGCHRLDDRCLRAWTNGPSRYRAPRHGTGDRRRSRHRLAGHRGRQNLAGVRDSVA